MRGSIISMRLPSVAMESTAARRERIARLTVDERVTLALALGRRNIATYASASGLEISLARLTVERRRQARRRVSGSMHRLLQ
jgi:hypothetical protein